MPRQAVPSRKHLSSDHDTVTHALQKAQRSAGSSTTDLQCWSKSCASEIFWRVVLIPRYRTRKSSSCLQTFEDSPNIAGLFKVKCRTAKYRIFSALISKYLPRVYFIGLLNV